MANEYYNVDPFVLWQEDHAWAHQPEFDVIDETIQGKLCQSSNSNLLSFLQLSLVIKPSPHHPVIPLSSHRLNWCQRVIMQSLQISPCPTLKKSPCPPVGYKHCCGIFTTLHKRKAHYSRVCSTLVPSVACQTTEVTYRSSYLPSRH